MDAPIVLLGLVTNLVEHSAMNRKRLLEKSQTVRFVAQSCIRYCRESLNIWNSLVVAEKENEQNDFTVDPQGIVLAAYMCLLLGCACVDSKAAQSTMLEILPDRSTRPFERLLTGFLRLQSVVGVLTTEALEGTRRVIELFQSYGKQQKDSHKIDEIVTSLEAVAEDQSHVLRQLTAPSVVISNDDDKEDVKIRKKKRKDEPGSPWRSRVLSRIKNSCSVSLCDDGDMFDDDDEDGVEESNEDVDGVEQSNEDVDGVEQSNEDVDSVEQSNEDTIEESIDEQDPVEESKEEESTTIKKTEEEMETYSGLNEYEKRLREQLEQGQIVISNKKKKKKRRKVNSPKSTKTQNMKRPSASILIRNDSFSSSSSLTSSQSSNGSTKKTFGRRKRKRHVDEITLWDED